jgi:hypothetical protein
MIELTHTITLRSGGLPSLSLLDLWLEKFDSISGKTNRKLCSLVLLQFLPTKDYGFLNKAGIILSLVVGVISELGDDSEINTTEIAMENGPLTIEAERRSYLITQDFVHSFKLKEMLTQSLKSAESLHGEPSFEQILSQVVDPSILNQIYQITRS